MKREENGAQRQTVRTLRNGWLRRPFRIKKRSKSEA